MSSHDPFVQRPVTEQVTEPIAHLDFVPECEWDDHRLGFPNHSGPAWALVKFRCPECGYADTGLCCRTFAFYTGLVGCYCGAQVPLCQVIAIVGVL